MKYCLSSVIQACSVTKKVFKSSLNEVNFICEVFCLLATFYCYFMIAINPVAGLAHLSPKEYLTQKQIGQTMITVMDGE